MTRYLLDTNIVSHLLKGTATVRERIVALPISSLCISAVTNGEMIFGLMKRPEAVRLRHSVRQFSQRVDVLPWDEQVSERYGEIRAILTRAGISLAPLDLMIFAHAAAVKAVLVTDDRAFLPAATHVRTLDTYAGFDLENWAECRQSPAQALPAPGFPPSRE